MRTIHEDLDDLDRMVDGDAPKDKIRSQIRLISREVATLEADYARLAQALEESNAALAELQKEHSEFKDAQTKRNRDAFSDKAARIRKVLTPPRPERID